MMVGMAILEMVGVASIMPFMAVLSDPEIVERNVWLSRAYELSGAESTQGFLTLLGAGVFLVLVGSLTFKAVTQWVQISYAQMRIHSLSCRLMARYLGQPYSFFLGRHSSKIATTILSEVNRVVTGALFPAMQIVAYGLVAIALFGLLLVVDFSLALIMGLTAIVVYGSLYLFIRKKLTRIGAIRLEANRRRFRVTHETFGGVKEVKIYGMEETMADRYASPSKRMARQEILAQVLAQIPNFGIQGLIYGGMILILLYLMAVYGSLGEALPVFATFAFAGYRMMPALQTIYRQASMLRVSRPALDSLVADLNSLQPAGALSRATDARWPTPEEAIELRDVTYSYPGSEQPALDGVDLRIPAKHTVGLVGTTGSGKTTTMDVILGLLSVESGMLLVDGAPVDASNVRAWQNSIGYVPQHIYLSDESIAANIAFGLPEDHIDHAAVERAARMAHLHEFVVNELPQGYNTIVGERGVRLSGGQRQRIGIARALYRDPDTLLLDEATSALDNVTENAVMAAIADLGHRKTIVIIAHRLSTVQSCDRIYLLEKGKVVNSGTFNELISKSAKFRSMAHGDE
ncbi:ABC transporter ATP-binding protein [Aquisalimonas sp. 2447]|nr:ABC transporter ATP-binding protein [Aquisalimonas sp. 2447]